jgi:hypothetical protein
VTNGAGSDMGAVAGAGWEGGRWGQQTQGRFKLVLRLREKEAELGAVHW